MNKDVEAKIKEWECAHSWWEDAEWRVSILYINRLHRSGPAGEYFIDVAEAWAKKCEQDLDRLTKELKELGYDPYARWR